MAPETRSPPFVETPEEIFGRVYMELKPRGRQPHLKVNFFRYANADSFARMANGTLEIRLPDILLGAPTPVIEALAYVLLGKLFRKPVAASYSHRYRLYLSRKDVRRSLLLLRQIRGRKFISGPQGDHYDLACLFEELNGRYFDGLLARPSLGWSRRSSRTTLGHYDPSHNAIILSKLLDTPAMPRLAVEYVLFHEMLHLRYPVVHNGVQRRVHTPEFRAAERRFPRLSEARELLKLL